MMSRDSILFEAGRSDVLGRDFGARQRAEVERQLQGIPNKLPPDPPMRVRLLRHVQLLGGQVGEPGDLVTLGSIDARGLIALGRAEKV